MVPSVWGPWGQKPPEPALCLAPTLVMAPTLVLTPLFLAPTLFPARLSLCLTLDCSPRCLAFCCSFEFCSSFAFYLLVEQVMVIWVFAFEPLPQLSHPRKLMRFESSRLGHPRTEFEDDG